MGSGGRRAPSGAGVARRIAGPPRGGDFLPDEVAAPLERGYNAGMTAPVSPRASDASTPALAPVVPVAPDALPDVRVPPPGPESQAWLRRLKAVESPNVTTVGPDFPVVWESAKGAVVRDVDGNTYLDAGSSFGVAFVGHGHPDVLAATQRQQERLVHAMGDVHPPALRIELLEALQRAAPGELGHAVLCTGGSEAVEVALKTAALATGRRGILAFEGGYHGLSLGALGATWRDDFRAPFRAWLPGPTRFVPFPQVAADADSDAAHAALSRVFAAVEAALADPDADIGVVMVEPVQGRGGTRVPPEGFLRGLHALCQDAGVLLCCDEIFTGVGRTGALFACAAAGVVPDLLCVGKALGGGWPVSACLGTPEVMAAWGQATGEALHTSTFLGHPVAAAAAVATLGLIQREGLATRAQVEGAAWLQALRGRVGGHPGVVEVRGRGLMLGVELRDHPTRRASDWTWDVVVACLRGGVIVLPCGAGDVIQLTPPVVMTAAQRAHVVATLGDALDAAWQAAT